jgi:hypothetical protein
VAAPVPSLSDGSKHSVPAGSRQQSPSLQPVDQAPLEDAPRGASGRHTVCANIKFRDILDDSPIYK